MAFSTYAVLAPLGILVRGDNHRDAYASFLLVTLADHSLDRVLCLSSPFPFLGVSHSGLDDVHAGLFVVAAVSQSCADLEGGRKQNAG